MPASTQNEVDSHVPEGTSTRLRHFPLRADLTRVRRLRLPTFHSRPRTATFKGTSMRYLTPILLPTTLATLLAACSSSPDRGTSDIASTISSFGEMSDDYEDALDDLDDARDDIEKSQKRIREARGDFDKARERAEKSERELEKAQDRLDEAQRRQRRAQATIDRIERQFASPTDPRTARMLDEEVVRPTQ